MAEDRESRPSREELLEYMEMLEHRASGAPRAPRAPRESGERREAGTRERRSEPLRRGNARPAQRPSSVPHRTAPRQDGAAPARRPKKRGMDREMRLILTLAALLVLILVLGTVFIVTNVSVARVENFAVSSVTTNSQVLSWEKTDNVDGYEIYDRGGTLLATVSADDAAQYAVDGLQSGTQYTYTIVAVKDFLGKHAGKAVELSAYTLPETVQTVSATASGTGAFVTWTDSGAAGYEVQYTDASGAPQTLETQNSGEEGVSIPDLEPGNAYTFQVRSFVLDGDSRVYSDWVSAQPIIAARTVDMAGIDVTKPMVALTFDDGPDYNGATERILDTLKHYGVHATFFQLGVRAADQPGAMQRMAAEGHEIGCHTYDHKHYGSDVTVNDIVGGDDAIEKASGVRPTVFRSPGGDTTDLIRETCRSEGMPIIHWNLDTADWQSLDADSVCNIVMRDVSDGDIILMHNIYNSTADAVERIVPYLLEQGYQLVTVGQLVQAKTGAPPVPGTQYYTATSTD